MHFHKSGDSLWLPCGLRHPGAIQTTLQELAAKGLAAKVHVKSCVAIIWFSSLFCPCFVYHIYLECTNRSFPHRSQTLHLSFFLSFLCCHPLLYVSQCNAKTVCFVLLHKFV
ncbi:unnamed protein product [Musa hybrid cultivar]